MKKPTVENPTQLVRDGGGGEGGFVFAIVILLLLFWL